MPDDRTVDFVVMFLVFGMVGLGLLSMTVGWVVRIWDRIVNRSADNAGDVMSPTACAVPHEEASAVQTRPQTPPDKPMMPVPTRDEMLDAFKILRKSGMAREEARAMLRILGHPLDNNLWSKAAPEEEPQITPIAGRPTAAKFHEGDPELEYQPLR